MTVTGALVSKLDLLILDPVTTTSSASSANELSSSSALSWANAAEDSKVSSKTYLNVSLKDIDIPPV